MSNALAIATVTTALAQTVRTAVQSVIDGADVLTERPDATAIAQPRVRLFLYQTTPNSALRNDDLPTRSVDGKLAMRPTVALDLHYLLAFYGDETQLQTQQMLGAVARDLHARPLLTRQMILNAVASQAFLNGSNLADAMEQVKFTPLHLSLEELSKLWSVFFQTPYALSVAYQATVVLIEREDIASRALPVLRRGEEDRGVDTQLGTFPVLESIHIGAVEDAGLRPRRPSYPNAELGSLLTVSGRNLGGDGVSVRFTHPRISTPKDLVISPADRTPTEIAVTIPNDTAAQTEWAAGFYTVAVIVKNGAVERGTNALPLALAPRMKSIAPASPVPRDAGGNVTLTITCSPQVLPEQRSVLLLADRDVPAQPHATVTDTLQFVIAKAPAVTGGLVQLRVDGVDSLPFKRTGTPPRLVFDDQQKVTIT